jgi:opacity protein-like surface antigen
MSHSWGLIMRRLQCALLATVAAVGFVSIASAADMPTKAPMAPAPIVVGGFFGEILGAYDFKDPIQGWRQFGIPGFVSVPEVGIGAGWNGRVMVGYRWNVWDVAVAGEWGSFREGDTTIAPGGSSPATMKAKMQAYDAQVGYNTMWGSTATRWALGVRYARWDNTASDDTARFMYNNWRGFGPRGELTTKTPLAPSWTLRGDVGLGVLFGKIDTTSSANWICTQCTSTTSTSLNLDGSLGIGYTIAPGADVVVGWKVEYWSRVNVADQDTTGSGANSGTSSHLSHGPFASLKFGIAP